MKKPLPYLSRRRREIGGIGTFAERRHRPTGVRCAPRGTR